MAGRTRLGSRARIVAVGALIAVSVAGCGEGGPVPLLRTETTAPSDTVEPLGWQQEALDRDRELVQAYGAERPDVYGGLEYDNTRTPSWLVAHFTQDLAGHDAALRSKLDHPERFEVRAAKLSVSEQERIQAELSSLGDGMRGTMIDHSAIKVTVDTARRDLADELLRRFAGHPIEITMGLFRYPDRGTKDACRELPGASALDSLTVTAQPTPEVVAGRVGGGEAVIRNRGSEPLGLFTGQDLDAFVLDRDGRVVAWRHGPQTMAGREATVPPGGTERMPIAFSTDSCRAELGWVLPPGDYTVVAVLGFADPERIGVDDPVVHHVVLSPPVPVRIVAGGR